MSPSGFATRLRASRAVAGKTQAAAAAEVGVHLVTYAKWEGSKQVPTTKRAERAAEVFGVRLLWLLTGKGRISGDRCVERAVKHRLTVSPSAVAA